MAELSEYAPLPADLEVIEVPAASKKRRKRSAEPVPAAPIVIPDKLFFSIGEVADLTGVPPYVLRYWESQFKIIAPEKNAAGQRIYRRREVDMIVTIRRLLYEEQFTIAGARRRLRESLKEQEDQSQRAETRVARREALQRVKGELVAIAEKLERGED